MSTFLMLLAAMMALGVAALLTYRLSRPTARFRILDHPNERSLHATPKPRTGGIAIVCATILGSLVSGIYMRALESPVIYIAIGAALVALISFLDDRYTISAKYRFLIHVVAAGILLYSGFAPDRLIFPAGAWVWGQGFAWAGTLLFVVWMINLYNFMDGMDGLAGGMAVIGFAIYALIGWIEGDALFSMFAVVVSTSAAGFLLFNFPPAKIFMGDTGSSTLGFLGAAFALWADREHLVPLWVSVVLFSPFIVDATVTLLRRLLHGEKVWEAHKTHYYQQLVQAGWGHRRTVLAEYGLMLCVGVMALAALYGNVSVQWAVVGALAVVYLTAIGFVSRMSRASQGKVNGKV